jgi:DNA replication protein DnaC
LNNPLPPADAPAYVLTDCVCDRHGKYQAYRPAGGAPLLGVDCPKCIDEAEMQQGAQRRARAAQQMRSKKLREIQSVSGIPLRFASKSLDDYQAATEAKRLALTICRRYAESWPEQYRKGGSLVLTGLPGTGKTHLACAIANTIMPVHMATAAFGAVSTIIRSVRSTYGGKGSETQALNDLLKPDLLVMDEIGAEGGSDHDTKLLFEIINKRYENLRPMILISNLNTDDLEHYLGHRAMDRFRECGVVVAFDWASHRGRQQGLV